MYKDIVQKYIALFMAVTFVIANHVSPCYSFEDHVSYPPCEPQTASTQVSPQHHFDYLPKEQATVTYTSPSQESVSAAPRVVFIDDAHCNYEVQKKIASILKVLHAREKNITVGVEGAFGRIDTTLFSTYPDQTTKEKVFDTYVKEGTISGVELFSLLSHNASPVVGLEEKELYRLEFQAYLDAMTAGTSSMSAIDDLIEKVHRLKSLVYSKDLYRIEKMRDAMRTGAIDTLTYIESLLSWCLTNPIDIHAWPSIQQLLKAKNVHRVDTVRLADELLALEDSIVQKLIGSPRERTLFTLAKELAILKKGIALELERDEYQYLKKNRHSFSVRHAADVLRAIDGTLPDDFYDTFLPHIDIVLNTIITFYDRALEREEVMAQNIIRTANTSAGLCVAVIGGFHREGMIQLLKRQSIYPVVITPKVMNAPQTGIYTTNVLAQSRAMRLNTMALAHWFDEKGTYTEDERLIFFKTIVHKLFPEGLRGPDEEAVYQEWKKQYWKRCRNSDAAMATFELIVRNDDVDTESFIGAINTFPEYAMACLTRMIDKDKKRAEQFMQKVMVKLTEGKRKSAAEETNRFYLCSASPRKKEIFASLVEKMTGVKLNDDFTITGPDSDFEPLSPEGTKESALMALAFYKVFQALQHQSALAPGVYVGSDFIFLDKDDQEIAKPSGAQEARDMYAVLAGQPTKGISGFVVVEVPEKGDPNVHVDTDCSYVILKQPYEIINGRDKKKIIEFMVRTQSENDAEAADTLTKIEKEEYHEITVEELYRCYVNAGLYKGKAGGIGIQDDIFFPLINTIYGDPYVIKGLSFRKLAAILTQNRSLPIAAFSDPQWGIISKNSKLRPCDDLFENDSRMHTYEIELLKRMARDYLMKGKLKTSAQCLFLIAVKSDTATESLRKEFGEIMENEVFNTRNISLKKFIATFRKIEERLNTVWGWRNDRLNSLYTKAVAPLFSDMVSFFESLGNAGNGIIEKIENSDMYFGIKKEKMKTAVDYLIDQDAESLKNYFVEGDLNTIIENILTANEKHFYFKEGFNYSQVRLQDEEDQEHLYKRFLNQIQSKSEHRIAIVVNNVDHELVATLALAHFLIQQGKEVTLFLHPAPNMINDATSYDMFYLQHMFMEKLSSAITKSEDGRKHRLLIDVQNKLVPFFKNNRLRIEQLSPPRGKEHRKELKKLGLHDVAVLIGEDVFGDIEGREGNVFVNMFPTTDLFVIRTKKNATSIENMARQNQLFSGPLKDYALHYEYSFQKKRTRNVQEKADDMHRMPDTTALEKDKFDVLMNEEFIHFMEQTSPEERMWRFMWHKEHGDPQNAFALIAAYLDGGVGSAALQTRREKSLGEWKSECELFLADVLKDEREKRNEAFQEGAALKINFESDSPVARKVVAGLIGTSTLEDYRAGHLLQLASLLKEQEVMRDQDIYRLNKDNPISAAMAVAVAKAWDIAVGQKEGFVMATHTVFCVGDGNIDDKPTIITQQNIDKLFKPKQDVRVYTAIAFVDLNTIKKGMTMPDGSTRYGIPEVKLGYGVAEMKMEDENGTFDADEGEELRARIEREAQERWEILNDFTPEWTGETLFKALQRAHIVYRRALPEGHGFTYEATPPFQKLFEEIFASEVSGEESWKMYFLKTIPQQHADESIGSNEDNRTRIEALIGEIKKRLIKHDDGHFLDEEFSLYNILTNRSYTDKELFNFVRTYILSRSYTHEIPFGLFDLYNPGLFSLVSKVIGDPFTVMGLPYDYFKEYCSSKKFITKKDALAPHEKIANLSFRRMEDMIKFRGPMKQYWEALDEAMRHNTSGSDTLNRMLENIRFNVKKIKLAQRERRLYDAVVYCSEMMDIIQSFASVYEREYKGSLFDEEPYLKEMLNELQKITAKYELGSLSFNPDKWNYDASDLNLVEQTELFRMLDWVTALAFRWPQREAAPRYLDATDKDISQFPHDWAGRYFFYDTCAWEKIERIESSLKRFTSYLASPVDTRSGTLPPKEVFSREEKTGKKAKKLKEEVFKQVYNDLVERIAREHFESDNIEYIRDKPYPLIDHRGGDGLHNEQGEKFFDVLEALIQKNKKDVSIFFNNAGDETILSLWQVCLLLYKGFDVTMYGSAFPTLNTDVTPDDLYFMIPYFDTLLRRQDVSEKYLLSTAFNEGRLAIVPFNAQYSDADDCRNRMIEEMNKYDMNIILGELWYGYLVGLGELSNDPFNAHYDEQYSHDNTAVARLSPVPHLKSGTYVFSIFVHKNARQMLEYRNSLSGAELERQDFIPKHTTAYKGFIFQLFKGGGWQSVHKELVLTYDEKFTLKDIFKEKGFTAFTANVKAACSYYFTLSEDRNLFALEASYNDADDCIQLEYTTPSRRITITIGNEKTTTAGRKRAVMAIDFAVNYEPLHRLNAEYEAIRRSEWPIFRAKIPSLIQDHTVNFLSNIPGNEEKASVEDPSLKYNFATVTLPRLDAVSAQQSGEVYDPSERIDYIRVDIPVDSFTKNKEQFSLLRARSDTVFFAKIEKLFSDGKENTPRTIVSLAPAFIVTTGKDTLFLRILIKNVQKTKNESSVEITDIFASDAACGDIVSFLENEKKIAFTMKNEKRNVTVAIEENSKGRTASTPFGFDIKTKKLTDILPTVLSAPIDPYTHATMRALFNDFGDAAVVYTDLIRTGSVLDQKFRRDAYWRDFEYVGGLPRMNFVTGMKNVFQLALPHHTTGGNDIFMRKRDGTDETEKRENERAVESSVTGGIDWDATKDAAVRVAKIAQYMGASAIDINMGSPALAGQRGGAFLNDMVIIENLEIQPFIHLVHKEGKGYTGRTFIFRNIPVKKNDMLLTVKELVTALEKFIVEKEYSDFLAGEELQQVEKTVEEEFKKALEVHVPYFAEELIGALKAELDIPVCVKTRLVQVPLPSSDEQSELGAPAKKAKSPMTDLEKRATVEFLKALAHPRDHTGRIMPGADWIVVHTRFPKENYKAGAARKKWEDFINIVKKIKAVDPSFPPVFLNGEVVSPESVDELKSLAGAEQNVLNILDGVMVATTSLGNPFHLKHIRSRLTGESLAFGHEAFFDCIGAYLEMANIEFGERFNLEKLLLDLQFFIGKFSDRSFWQTFNACQQAPHQRIEAIVYEIQPAITALSVRLSETMVPKGNDVFDLDDPAGLKANVMHFKRIIDFIMNAENSTIWTAGRDEKKEEFEKFLGELNLRVQTFVRDDLAYKDRADEFLQLRGLQCLKDRSQIARCEVCKRKDCAGISNNALPVKQNGQETEDGGQILGIYCEKEPPVSLVLPEKKAEEGTIDLAPFFEGLRQANFSLMVQAIHNGIRQVSKNAMAIVCEIHSPLTHDEEMYLMDMVKGDQALFFYDKNCTDIDKRLIVFNKQTVRRQWAPTFKEAVEIALCRNSDTCGYNPEKVAVIAHEDRLEEIAFSFTSSQRRPHYFLIGQQKSIDARSETLALIPFALLVNEPEFVRFFGKNTILRISPRGNTTQSFAEKHYTFNSEYNLTTGGIAEFVGTFVHTLIQRALLNTQFAQAA